MKRILFYIALFCLFASVSFTSAPRKELHKLYLLNKKEIYQVENNVILRFLNTSKDAPLLFCSHSYGSTLLNPIKKSDTLTYVMPKSITQKAGIVEWELLQPEKKLQGSLRMLAKTKPDQIESYLGPSLLEAGEKDFATLVNIPIDVYDNPLPDNTLVISKQQFLGNQNQTQLRTKGLIAHQKIKSTSKTGRILISTECKNIDSQEYLLDVTAAIPNDFTITASRPHTFADGNQVTTFKTSLLKDSFGNVVSDGTFVLFNIVNKAGNILQASGVTQSGIAQAKMVHPDHADRWEVRAKIEGMAKSNLLRLDYKAAVKDLSVTFSKNKRNIKIGPIKSFMGQAIPDGLPVKLVIYQNKKEVSSLLATTYKGKVEFELKKDILKNGNYRIDVEAAGLKKTYPNTVIW